MIKNKLVSETSQKVEVPLVGDLGGLNFKDMNSIYNYFLLLIISLALFSCTVDEFQPEPVGEKVPFLAEQLPALQEALQTSGHSLFLAAWNKSTLNDSLTAWEGTPLAILVPSDAAFEAEGYTADKIAGASAGHLDTLLLYLCLQVDLDTIANAQTTGNVKIRSKLTDPVIKEGSNSSDLTPFILPHYIGIEQGRLFVNGKNTGDFTIKRVQHASLLFTGHLFLRPTKDIWTFLQEDGRFTEFVKILTSADAIYATRMPDARMKPWLAVDSTSTSQMIRFISIFAPTDEAFAEAGYTSTALRVLNLKYQSKINTVAYSPYQFMTFLKSDSIISYHSWGMRYLPASAAKANPTVFFSNEMTNEYLGKYILQPIGWKPIEQPIMRVPFEFGEDEAGHVTVKLKNAKEGTDAATMTESDIMTLNGPVHVVDRLFVPEGF